MALHSCLFFCCLADEEALPLQLALLKDGIIFVSMTGRFYSLMGLLLLLGVRAFLYLSWVFPRPY